MSKLTKAIIKVTDDIIDDLGYLKSEVQELCGQQLEVILTRYNEYSYYVCVDCNPELNKYIREGRQEVTLLSNSEFTILMEIPYEE